MLNTTKKLKWLLVLVLIFGGFTVYKLFEELARESAYHRYEWLFKIMSEFGLFVSVIISVGYFHHWFIAAEESREAAINLQKSLSKYVDAILLNSIKRGFAGITNKEFDFSRILQGLSRGDYIYWLITFDPRFKNKSRELEFAIRQGVHFRILILKADGRIGDLRALETRGFNVREYHDYSKLFKITLDDIASRIDDGVAGSLGVFVYDGLPCVPLFIVVHAKSKKVDVYSSYYLSEPVSKMPYLHWETEFKPDNQAPLESGRWNMADLFLDYFKTRWDMEKQNCRTAGPGDSPGDGFIGAPGSARDKCLRLYPE